MSLWRLFVPYKRRRSIQLPSKHAIVGSHSEYWLREFSCRGRSGTVVLVCSPALQLHLEAEQ